MLTMVHNYRGCHRNNYGSTGVRKLYLKTQCVIVININIIMRAYILIFNIVIEYMGFVAFHHHCPRHVRRLYNDININ